MRPTIRKAARLVVVLMAAFAMMSFGFLTSLRALLIIEEWSHIPNGLATVALRCAAAGPAMLVGGLWALVSLGRHRFPLWMGGAASVLVGTVIVLGTLTYIIPCYGPS